MAAADPGRNRRLTRRLSIGGLLAGGVMLLVALKVVLPTADLALMALTSLCMAIAVIELGLRPALLVYLAAALICLAWPGLAAAFPFIVLFGPYPLARALIERLFGKVTSIVLKLAAGNILTGLAAVFFAWDSVTALAARYSLFWVIVPVLLQIVLLVYDYALGLMIQFYMLRMRPGTK